VVDILSQQFGIADQRRGTGIVTLFKRTSRLLLEPRLASSASKRT
jgi:hypothetical protein